MAPGGKHGSPYWRWKRYLTDGGGTAACFLWQKPDTLGESRKSTIARDLRVPGELAGIEVNTMTDGVSYFAKLKFILGKDARHIPGIAMLYVVQGGLDFLGASLIAPLIYIIASPKAIMKVMHYLPFLPPDISHRTALLSFSGLLVGIFAARGISSYIVQRAVFTYLARERERLQIRMLQAYQSMPYEFHLAHNPNHMIAVIYSHVSNVSEMAIGSALRVLGDSIVFTSLLAVLLVTDVTAVLVLGPVLLSVIFVFRVLMTEQVREAGHQSGLALARLLASIQNALNGIKEIRILGVEEHFVASARRNVKQYADAFITYSCISVIPRFFIEFLVISSVAVLAVYYTLRGDAGEHVMATLGVFAIVGLRIMPSVQNILLGLNNIAFSKPSVEYLYADLKELDGRGETTAPLQIAATSGPVQAFEKLVLKDVSYRYPGSERLALDRINLDIQHGQSIGVVGPSGSGKSTLIDVIIGLIGPSTGEILCNGRNIHDPASGWQKLVAYIPQMLFLTDDTLRRNVALGVSDAEIDEERLHMCLRQARIDDLVATLPDGLGTTLGDRGLRISGGQRQRVALARTFYFGRQVLVLDEATSALDQEVETEIVEEIHRLKGTKTLIVIAHRLSTVRECDFLIRIEKGRIVASGSFEQVVGAADTDHYRIVAVP